MNNNKNKTKSIKKIKNRTPDADKFIELANIRVPKALRVLKSISSLSDDERYEYTDKQVDSIISALTTALDDITKAFKNGGKKDEEVFRL